METTEQIGSKQASALSGVDLREVRRIARRAERSQEAFNAAEPQVLREWLWRVLTGDLDPEVVRTIYPLILNARRVALGEWKRAQEKTLSADDQSAIARRLFGDFPPVRALDAPPKPVGI